MLKSLNELLDKLPTEAETADYLQKLERRTGVKADRVIKATETLAEKLVVGLSHLEERAVRAAGFAGRVNQHVEQHVAGRASDGNRGASTTKADSSS